MQEIIVDFQEFREYIFGMEKKTATRGRPPKGDESRSARINMRAEPTEKELYERAAAQAGLSLTDWMKGRLVRAARRELGDIN